MFDLLAIFGAKYLFVFSLLSGGVYFLRISRNDQKRLLILGVISLPLIFLTALIAGHLYYDPRPFVVRHFTPLVPHDPDNGFPSDHTLLVSAVAAIISMCNRRVATILWLIAILVALSRVYVGVHHSSDVIASMIISITILALVYRGMKYFLKVS